MTPCAASYQLPSPRDSEPTNSIRDSPPDDYAARHHDLGNAVPFSHMSYHGFAELTLPYRVCVLSIYLRHHDSRDFSARPPLTSQRSPLVPREGCAWHTEKFVGETSQNSTRRQQKGKRKSDLGTVPEVKGGRRTAVSAASRQPTKNTTTSYRAKVRNGALLRFKDNGLEENIAFPPWPSPQPFFFCALPWRVVRMSCYCCRSQMTRTRNTTCRPRRGCTRTAVHATRNENKYQAAGVPNTPNQSSRFTHLQRPSCPPLSTSARPRRR